MASSASTPQLHLSQFNPDDRPSWIDDYNKDMRIIDAASKTVYNYFTWNGSELITLMTSGTDDGIAIANQSQTGGIGDNDAISLIHDGTGIQINQDGIYVVWSTITTSLFVPDNPGVDTPTALSLVCDKDGLNGPEKTEIINGSFITPLTAKIEIAHPTQEKAQALTIPPTIVRMDSGGFMALTLAGNQNMSGNVELYHLETRMGIIKIR